MQNASSSAQALYPQLDPSGQFYVIPAITVVVPRFRPLSSDESELYQQQTEARKQAFVTLFSHLFPDNTVVSSKHSAFPTVVLNEPVEHVSIVLLGKTYQSDAQYLQLTYAWGYGKYNKAMRRVKLSHSPSGETLLSKKRMHDVAAEFVQMRSERLRSEEEDKQNAQKLLSQSKEQFSQSVAKLAALGLADRLKLDDKSETQGWIYLERGNQYGAQIQISGERAFLSTGIRDDSRTELKFDLIPEFVSLFDRNYA